MNAGTMHMAVGPCGVVYLSGLESRALEPEAGLATILKAQPLETHF